jgi:hypothetical protein
MESTDLELRKAKIQKVTKVGLGLVGAVLISPVVFLAVKGIVGLAIAFVVGEAVVQFAPVVSMKFANWKLRALIDEARRNPVETMTNIYLGNMRTIQQKDEKIKAVEARYLGFKDKAGDYVKKYGQDDAQSVRYLDAVKRVQALLVRQKSKQKAAKTAAVEYQEQIQKATDIWEMAKEMNAMNELTGDLEKQAFDDIKKRVAFDSVTFEFNRAVAELAVEADTEPEFDALPPAPAPTGGAA